MNSNGKTVYLAKKGTRYVSKWHKEELTCVKFDTSTYLDGRVAVIMLSRPKQRNAWTEIMRNELVYCIEEANKMKKIRAIILTGDPKGKAFCFGADLSPQSEENPMTVEGDVPEGRRTDSKYYRDGGGIVGLAVINSLKPVIAAINGGAVGVGLTLPTSCDIVIANEEAKVGYVFNKRGLAMECISSFTLSRAIGYKKAMELVLTARVFKAKDAPEGLFNYTLPEDKVMPKALEIAAEICNTSPLSTMFSRNMIIRNSYGTSPEEAHLIESKVIYHASNSADAREGILSFIEKRPAKFPSDPYNDAPEWFPYWRTVATRSKL